MKNQSNAKATPEQKAEQKKTQRLQMMKSLHASKQTASARSNKR